MSKGKVNLKDKFNDKEIDLSLCNLTEVPVYELAAFPNATGLDLSCNNLSILPMEFCNLSHLIKVDLSKNQLLSLPEKLGCLRFLQHLDLYNNKITMLPVSFSQLTNLKWLDLKDNPLELNLAKAAGDCLDEKQCKQCAFKVVQYMKVLQENVDKVREQHLLREKELEKEREVQLRAREAKERETRKREKAEEKERKRKEYNIYITTLAIKEQRKKKRGKKKDGVIEDKKAIPKAAPKTKHSFLALKLLVLLLLAVGSLLMFCQLTEMRKETVCLTLNVHIDEALSWARGQEAVMRQLFQKLSTLKP